MLIFGIFALSLGGSLLLQHFQDVKAIGLVNVSLNACKADVFLTFCFPSSWRFFGKSTSAITPIFFNRAPYYRAIIDFFGKNAFNKTSLLISLGKRTAMRSVPDPTPKQLEMYLPKEYSYEFHKFFFSLHNTLKVNGKVQVVGVTLLILNDTDPTLLSLSKLFKVNFSREALYLESFSYAKVDGIYGMNSKVVKAFVTGMNSTILAKMAFMPETEMIPWEIYRIWENQGTIYMTSPSVLILSKSYFLRENRYTFEGVHGIGLPLFLMGYGITVKGLGYCPFLQSYLNKIIGIISPLIRVGGFVYAPKAAAITAALGYIHPIVLLTKTGTFIICLLASIATARISTALVKSSRKGSEMELKKRKDKSGFLLKCFAAIFVPLGIFLVAFTLIEAILAISLPIFLLTYFPLSATLSLISFSQLLSKPSKEPENVAS